VSFAEKYYLSSKENLILYLDWLIIRKIYLNLHLPIKNLTPKYVLITGTPGDYDAKIGIKNELCK